MSNPLSAFAAAHQRGITALVSDEHNILRHYVNAALNLAYPGSKRQLLNRPIPERTMQVAILAAFLARSGYSTQELEHLLDKQDAAYAAAVAANVAAGQAEDHYQRTGAKNSRAEATANLLATLDLKDIQI